MYGGGQNFYHTYISKGYNLVHRVICDFQYPLSYEHVLALLLYNDLYVIVFKLLNFLVGKILEGGQLPPAPPPPFLWPCTYARNGQEDCIQCTHVAGPLYPSHLSGILCI